MNAFRYPETMSLMETLIPKSGVFKGKLGDLTLYINYLSHDATAGVAQLVRARVCGT